MLTFIAQYLIQINGSGGGKNKHYLLHLQRHFGVCENLGFV